MDIEDDVPEPTGEDSESSHSVGSEHDSDETTFGGVPDFDECVRRLDRYWAPNTGSATTSNADLPQLGERYQVQEEISRGSFGAVYLARDLTLDRQVAIKIPLSNKALGTEAAKQEFALSEAKTVAALKHPNIVAVYDVGSCDEHPLFLVSQFVDGQSLRDSILKRELSVRESVSIIALVAEALSHAHTSHIIHRDIKPSNILLDRDRVPFLVDFGLSHRFDTSGSHAGGTTSYVSPEQASDRLHRVNQQSDIFSLGVTLYECLTGNQPFIADTNKEILQLIAKAEPVFPPVIPYKLRVILERAMAKRQTDRYANAREFANDLRSYLGRTSPKVSVADREYTESDVNIVPKGLRSFDIHDSDYFLKLLPPPRDKDGIPDSVRFWVNRIGDAQDGQESFEVAVLYGPSGCGKSSFVKAALIPNLNPTVCPIYVEAVTGQLESCLAKAISNHLLARNASLSLNAALEALQEQANEPDSSQKYVIFIDQFEQWLQHNHEFNSELVSVLEKCDGQSVQAVLMVRDDFWMRTTRLMRVLDIPLIETDNARSIDLFDLRHARMVVRMFGRANGDLPNEELSREQSQFIHEVVDELATENHVVPVRIALFAQMMKGKNWCGKLMHRGTSIGVAFLDDAFCSSTATPEHRLMEQPARNVLTKLLPESGVNIKGHVCNHDELFDASNCSRESFDRLIRILDHELRLITPTDPNAINGATANDQTYYQLTHDYLVPSVREWIFQRQAETVAGRAYLRLKERCAVWSSKPEPRHLPSLSETVGIFRYTRQASWTGNESAMMHSAKRHQIKRAFSLLLILSVLVAVGVCLASYVQHQRKVLSATNDVRTLLVANPSELPPILNAIRSHRDLSKPALAAAFNEPENESDKLHAAIGMADESTDACQYLTEVLPSLGPEYVRVIRDELQSTTLDGIKSSLENQIVTNTSASILPAAAVLVKHASESTLFDDQALQEKLSRQLVSQSIIDVNSWVQMFAPRGDSLTSSLTAIFLNRDSTFSSTQVDIATGALKQYCRGNAEVLTQLLIESSVSQFNQLLPELQKCGQEANKIVSERIRQIPNNELILGPEAKRLARMRANTLLLGWRLDEVAIPFSALSNSIDPTVRTELIHLLKPCGVEPVDLISQLENEEVSIRRAMILGLGELAERMTESAVDQLVQRLFRLYEFDPDPGIHAAARWTLLNRIAQDDSPRRESYLKRLAAIDSRFALGAPKDDRRWYVTKSGGHTMVVFDGPLEFMMGSTEDTEKERDLDELYRKRTISRSIAVGMFEVTSPQYSQFFDSLTYESAARDDIYDINDAEEFRGSVSWYLACQFCNWLSQQEGIPESQWCYPTDYKQISEGMVVDQTMIEKTGYRLLTEAEWEYAARGGTLTTRHFGSNEHRFTNYGWWIENSGDMPRPIGMLKPNDFGLFDTLGNGLEWCFSGSDTDLHAHKEDRVEALKVTNKTSILLRGGSFASTRRYCRSAYREGFTPDAATTIEGLRIGRTLPSKP